MMTPEQIAAMRADAEAGTKGPWDWEVNQSSKSVNLCGGKGASDLTVMSFGRYGMSGAAPIFWDWVGNVAERVSRADKLTVAVDGREHHRNWFARIDHPDARRIARVPDMEATIIAQAEYIERLKSGIPWREGPPPEEWRDGRQVLVWARGFCHDAIWEEGLGWYGEPTWLGDSDITHHAAITKPGE